MTQVKPHRIIVTGRDGQIAAALARTGAPDVELIRVGRPDLDLDRPDEVAARIATLAPDLVINAAAWTAVDKAESEPERAHRVNAMAAGEVARGARVAGAAVIQLSTDYVFDGRSERPYREDSPTAPTNAYGDSKLAGEAAVRAANPDHLILRMSWVHAPWGQNFVRTMLRLAQTRPEVSVVADQFGCPTFAPDAATALIGIARRLLADPQDAALRGVFHLGCAGETASWADVAEEVFHHAVRTGRPAASVRRITTADYPTPAHRPAMSRLDGALLQARFGILLPDWRDGVARCVAAVEAADGDTITPANLA